MGNSAGKLDKTEKKSKKIRGPGFLHLRKTGEKELRNRTERHYALPNTTLYELPLEVLDIVLHKSYLHWIFNSTTKQRDEEVIRSLISVDVCFYQRITRGRFKKATWRYIEKLYSKHDGRSVIRNNRKYLVENIQPNGQLLDLLLSLNCLTEEQLQFIRRLHLDRDKNAEILRAMRPFDEKRVSKLMRCLRQTNQEAVEKVIKFGGVVVKVKTKQRPSENDKLFDQLRDDDLEILNHQLGRQSVLWIWCKSQRKLQQLQKLNESNFFKNWNIDCNQLQREIVMFPISVSFVGRLNVHKNEYIRGVTKLQNAICVLCRRDYASISPCEICVFEDRNPFRLQKEIAADEFNEPTDIVSTEKQTSVYVADYEEKCIWKVTIEIDGQHKIINWLTTDYKPLALSVSSDGQLLVVDWDSPILRIYGSDAELLRSIQFSRDIKNLWHAVETSIGNFIILHLYGPENGKSRSSGRQREKKLGICEVTGDGQTVIRRFIPSNETQEIFEAHCLLLDLDDRVFVADAVNHRVILLDSDLKWNRIICSTSEVRKKQWFGYPWNFCYGEERKQLIVGDEYGGVNVYNLKRN